MASDDVIIKIDGDDSGFRQKIQGVEEIATNALSGISKVAKGASIAMGALSAAAGAAWSAVGLVGVKYNAQIEQLQTSFTVMTGSAEKAGEVIDRVRKIAAETPFELAGLAETTQLLMNYGMTADDAISRMTMLGDIAQGDAEKMNRIATAYGQMSSAGKVSLEDVKQMIEAGFNPLQIISEKTGESMASLYDRISRGTIAVSEITDAMATATSVGGKYFQSMEKQSQTLNGQLSTLKDGVQELSGKIMEPLSESLRTTLLPEAIRTVGEMQKALSQGGIEGALNYASGRLPELLSAGTDMATTLIRGAVKGMPKAAKMLAKALPDILSSLVATAPELVQGGFDMVAQMTGGIVARLPELVPLMIQGVAGLAKSLLGGIGSILSGIENGIYEAFFHAGNRWIKQAKTDMPEYEAEKASFEAAIEMNATVEDNATSAVEGAVKTLQDTLNGIDVLTPEKQREIIDAISADVDPIMAALNGSGVDTSTPEGASKASEIFAAAVELHKSIMAVTQVGAGMDIAAIAEAVASGRDALVAALMDEGIAQKDAEAMATNIETAYNNYQSALTTISAETGLSPTDIASTIAQGRNAVVSAFIDAGMTEGQANTAADEIMGLYTALNNSMALGKTVIPIRADELATAIKGGRDSIVSLLIASGWGEAQAGEAATAITDGIGKITAACEGVDGVVPDDIISIVTGDRSKLVSALNSLGLKPEDLTAVVTNLIAVNNSIKDKVKNVYDTIYGALTDGEKDTPEQTQALKELAQGYYDELMAGIDLNTTEGQNYANKLQSLLDATTAYIDKMSGKSTETVRASHGELMSLSEEARQLHAQIMGYVLEAEAQTANLAGRQVRAGITGDSDKVQQAFAAEYAAYEKRRQEIAEQVQTLIDANDAEWEASDKGEEANARYKERADAIALAQADALRNAQREYQGELNELFAGLFSYYAPDNPEAAKAMEDAQKEYEKADYIQGILETINDPEKIKKLTQEQRDEMNAALKELIGLETGDGWFQTSQESLFAQLEEGGDPLDIRGRLNDAMYDSLTRGDSAQDKVPEAMRGLIAQMLELGLIDGLDINPGETRDLIGLALGKTDLPEQVSDGLTEMLEDLPGSEPVTVSPEVNVEPEVNAAEVAQTVQEELAEQVEQTLPVEAQVGVELGTSTGDAAADAGQVRDAAVAELEQGASGAKTAGANLGQGFADGISSKMGAVVTKAIALAKAAINAIDMTVENASPSKAARRSGKYVGEGFVLGLGDQIKAAQTAGRTLGGAGLAGLNIGGLRVAAQVSQASPRTEDYAQILRDISQRPVDLY
ncbi:MAG: tape measure protein, partial [Clostridia bacterium]|nr:tape measure protein [Clostridia bacterium]